MKNTCHFHKQHRFLTCAIYVIFLVKVCLYSAAEGALAATKCPSLVPGLHQSISDTSAYVGDSVQVSCDPGYVLDVGSLMKDVQCVNSSNILEWNDTLGDCIPKECPAIQIANNMTVESNDTSYVIGDNVTITCSTGHAFSVNLTLNVTDRVTASKTLMCIDDPNGAEGKWNEELGNCSVIECAPAYTVKNAYMSNQDNIYQSTAVYTCYSGYMLGSRATLTATCNDDATWDMYGWDLESELYCGKRSFYVGCLEASAIPDQHLQTFSVLDVSDCLDHCRASAYRFAALHEANCTCSNSIADDFVILNNALCNVTCTGYDGGDEYQTVFCGGPGSLKSVYVTVDGCFANVSVNEADSEEVVAKESVTCIERCRTKDFSHFSLINTTCYCVNMSQVSGDEVESSKCWKTDGSEYLKVQDLAKTIVTAGNCTDLYKAGIRMHGTYVLKNGTKTYCHFKDGTICDDGWIGYNNSCYKFYTEETMNFTEARDFCTENEAEMVSVLDQKEAEFLKETRNLFSDLKDKVWYLGMVDSHKSSLFSWMDGNLFSYSNFGDEEPSSVDICVKDHASGYLWASVHCSEKMYVICKTTKSIHRCAGVDVSGAISTRTELTMSLPYCVEICRGQGADYSAVSDTDCYCLPGIPAATQFSPRSECDLLCPGNQYQYCGNGVNFTVIEVSERLPAKSCEDLQLIGIGNGSFVIKPDNDTTVQTCAVPECPYAWVEIRGRCYRFNPVQTAKGAARKFCSQYDAYPVVLETEQETEELMNTVANISVYSTTRAWRIGLLALSLSSGLYRWANGKLLNNDLWSNDFTTIHDGVEVVIPRDNYTEWFAQDITNTAFICEKGQEVVDYLGCYNNSGLNWDINITDFGQMTIQQCVEWCRGQEKEYAFLGPTECVCSDSLTERAAEGYYCHSRCSGQNNQICGGEGVMSVYNISEYGPLADVCSNLTDASITLSGTYMVGGVLTYCNLSDGSTICDTGWIGYETHCYKFDPDIHDRTDWWYDNDVVMISVTTREEYLFLIKYLRTLYLGYAEGRVLTGLKDTFHLRIYSNQDGLLFKPTLSTGGYPTHAHHMDAFAGFHTHGFSLSQHGDTLGFLGKKDKYKIGCYEIPTWITPVLSNFNSMELTQCKQLCLAQDEQIAMVTLDSCYCGNLTLLSQLVPSDDAGCKMACNLHTWQWCGNGTSALAYYVEENEEHLAADCDELYLSGVFYKSTYKLWNGSHIIYETCGFTDGTVCPAAWFGKDGHCYKLFITHKSFEDARSSCFKQDSYLFSPTNSSKVWSLLDSLQNISVLNHVDRLITGILVVYFNTTHVTSDGVTLDLSEIPGIGVDELPEAYVSASITERGWGNLNPSEKLPYLCQRNDDYLGCNKIDSPPDANISDVTDMSVTLCVEYCRGQDASFFGTTQTSCHCYNSEPTHLSYEGKCLETCAGSDTQPCGGTADDGTQLFSLYQISNKTTFAKSCVELARYGIRHPGEYYIEPDPTVGIWKVACFNQTPPITEISTESYKHLKVSSSQSEFVTTRTFHEYSLHEVWQPESNDAQEFLKLSLTDVHIITGIVLSGVHTADAQFWVTKIRVSYRDPLTGALVVYSEFGTEQIIANSNGIDSSYVFFSMPFVTDEITINPLEWHFEVAMKVFLLGQLYKTFNHEDSYVGCVMDHASISNSFPPLFPCLSLDSCVEFGEPFLFLDEYGDCNCGFSAYRMGFQYGFEGGMCPWNGTMYIGQGDLFKAVYRTYEKRCATPAINLADGQTANITYPYVDNIYTYGTTAKYLCDIGYEFDDQSSDVTIACRQDNQWDNITQTCTIISCESFNVSQGTVTISSLEYLGVAHVLCDSGHWADNGRESINVTCEANKDWTITPTCSENNLKKNSRYFSSHGGKERDSSAMISEGKVRSSIDCSVKCVEEYYCKGVNFQESSDGSGICRLFTEYADATDLSSNTDWKYYETFGDT